MINLILVELAVTVLAGLVFLVMYLSNSDSGLRSPLPGVRAASWHLLATTSVVIAESLSLLVILFGVRLPIWPFAVIYGVSDLVILHRIYLLLWSRRSRRAD